MGFSTYIAMVAKIGSLCRSLAKSFEKLWQKTLKQSGVFCRITKENLIAAAQRAANGKPILKMNNRLSPRERRHLAAVKEMPCGVCGAAGPSDAHHIEQGLQFTCIPLCKDCHQGSHNGIHGRRAIWNVTKKTEMSVLNDTVEQLTRKA